MLKCGHPDTDDNIYLLCNRYRYCVLCRRERSKQSYRRNPEKRKIYAKEYRRTQYLTRIKPRVQRIRQLLLDQRKVCSKCGETHPGCLDFHHRNPKEKSFALVASQLGNRSWKAIQDELNKCDVLCANCHRKHHYNVRKAEQS